jgi:hypothetical protein
LEKSDASGAGMKNNSTCSVGQSCLECCLTPTLEVSSLIDTPESTKYSSIPNARHFTKLASRPTARLFITTQELDDETEHAFGAKKIFNHKRTS